MCGKGSQTTTQATQQNQTPNPQAMAAYQAILQQAQGVAGTPYQPYPGQGVAPVNAQQYAGIGNINAFQSAYPVAEGLAYNAAQPISAADISQYESPYTQQVVNATEAQFANQNAQQQQQVLGNAVAQGALGGNRVGIAQAELANQQNLAQAPVIANLENQGYMTGLNTALTEQQAGLQGAYGVANMANAGLQGANAQIGAGTLEQQTQQALDQYLYQQYLNQMGYPFQTTGWEAGLAGGLGSLMGGTTSGYGATTGPPPNSTAQWLGLGAAGLGAFGQFAGSAAGSALLAGLARGGGVVGYADGGGVAHPAMPMIPESHHTLRAQQKQLIDGDRHVQMFPHGHAELPLPSGMKRTHSHSGVFHHNPKHVSEDEIHHYSRGGHEHVLLGLGPYSKHEIMHRIAQGEHPVAVVERNKHGHEVRAALGTHATVHVQHEHMSRGKSRNHTLHIEHPHKVLIERMVAHRQSGGAISATPYGGGLPYAGGTSYIPGVNMPISNTMPKGMQAPSLPQQQAPGQPNQFGQVQSGLSNFAKGLGNYNTNTSNDTSYDPSMDDEFGMEEWSGSPNNWRGGAIGVANRADGGGLMSLDDYAAGLKKMMIGRASGGVANRDRGGDLGAPLNDPNWDDTHQADPPIAAGVADPSIATTSPTSPPPLSEDEALAYGPAKMASANTGVAPATTTDTGVTTPSTHVPRGIRNNNPGNIEDGPFARTQPGYLGSDGRFAVFDNMDNGKAATSSLLGSYGNKGINTLSGIVNRWAPAADGNNTNAYIAAVARQTGLNPNAPLDMKDPALMGRIADAIHTHENGQPVGYSNRLATQNYNRSYGALDIPPEQRANARAQDTGVANPGFLGMSPDFWSGLTMTGLNIAAAGARPGATLAGAIGQGAGEAIKYSTGLKLNEQQMGLKAQQLQQQADHWQKEYENTSLQRQETVRHNKAEEARQAQETTLKAAQPMPFYEQGVGMNYVSRTPEGDVVLLGGPNAGKVIAGPHAGQMQQQPPVQPGVNAPAPVNPNTPTSQQPAVPGTPQTAQQQQNVKVASLDPNVVGSVVAASNRAKTPYNYSDVDHLPVVNKGDDVAPAMPYNGVSSADIRTAAENYLATGKLPQSFNQTGRGGQAMAIANNDTLKYIRNYANQLAASRGISSDQLVQMWRLAPNMAKYLSGKDADQTVSLGTAVRHLQTMQELADAWEQAGNGNFGPLNSIKAKISRMFGADAVTNLEAGGHIVGPEIIKAIGVAGAGTSEERQGAASGFMGSPDQIRGAIKTIQKLLLGQLVGKENKAKENGVSEDQFKGLIGGDSYDYLKKLEAVGSSLTGQNPAPGQTGAASSTQSAAPMQPPVPGAKFYQGSWYTRGPDGRPVKVQP